MTNPPTKPTQVPILANTPSTSQLDPQLNIPTPTPAPTPQPTKTTDAVTTQASVTAVPSSDQTKAPGSAKETLAPRTAKTIKSNMIHSIGPYFESFKENLTENPRMFTPLDLSEDGEQVFDLIADNAYKVGEVHVIVKNGMVTVTYKLVKGVKLTSKLLVFFRDIDHVTTLNTAKLRKQALRFNTPLSIGKRLKGDTKVLMYIAMGAKYKTNLKGIEPFPGDTDAYQRLVEGMIALMD